MPLKKSKLGIVCSGPGELGFFGMNIIQNQDKIIRIDARDKMESIMEYAISRPRRRLHVKPMNLLENSAFSSVNSSLGWLGVSAARL